MKRVRIAIIGLGYWGPNLLRNFSQCEEAEVAYACDADEKKIEAQRHKYRDVTFTKDYKEVLNDSSVDAIAIATPVVTHYALAKAALEAGKHVLVEKPLTANSAEAKELVDLAAKKKLILLVDHTFVYEDAITRMKKFIDDGALGKLLYYDSSRINLGIIQKDTNVLWDLAIHDLSILNHLRPLTGLTSVLAYGHSHHTKQTEMAHLHLTFDDGFTAHIHVSWLSPVKIRQTLIGGTEKMITYNDNEPSEKVRLYDKGVTVTKEEQSFALPVYRSGDIMIPHLKSVEPLKILALHFSRCVQGKEQPLTPGANALHIIEVLEHADKSLCDRSVIRLSA